MFKTMKLVYKNMWVGRPKFALFGIMAVAFFTSGNLYLNLLSLKLLSRTGAIVFSLVALSIWLVALPMVMTLIDLKHKPQRMDKLWNSL